MKNLLPGICIAAVAVTLLSYQSYAQAHDWLWARSAGSSINERAFSVASDANGNIFVAGNFNSAFITFGSDTLNNPHEGAYEFYMVKYDNSGNVVWAKSAGDSSRVWTPHLAIDPSGNVIVLGSFEGASIIFGPDTLVNHSDGSSDLFLVKYDNNGNVIWAKCAGGNNYETAMAVTTGTGGNIYITGGFLSSTFIFGTDTLTNFGGTYMPFDIFLAKYDSNGNVLWARGAGGDSWDRGNALYADNSGNVYVAGWFESTFIVFGTDTLFNNHGATDFFIVKYDASGNVLWDEGSDGDFSDMATSLCADAAGYIYMAGYFQSSAIHLGAYTLTNTDTAFMANTADMFLVKYNTNGNIIWAKSAGGHGYEMLTAAATGLNGNIIMAGTYDSDTLLFDTDTLVSSYNGYKDFFIVDFDSNGNTPWAKRVICTDVNFPYTVSTDPGGNIYLAGYFITPDIIFGPYTLTNYNPGTADMFVAKLSATASGIEIIKTSDNILIYPNPVKDILTIENLSSKMDIDEIVSIYDIQGKLLLHQSLQQRKSELDISDFTYGIYMVKVVGNDINFSKKILKE